MVYGFGNSKIQQQLQQLKDEKAARKATMSDAGTAITDESPDDEAEAKGVPVIADIAGEADPTAIVESAEDVLEDAGSAARAKKMQLMIEALKSKLCSCWA